MFHRPELLCDFLDEILEPRCTVGSRDVEVVFTSGRLSHIELKSFLVHNVNYYSRFPDAK